MPLSAGADQNQTTSRILNKLQYAMTDVAADIGTATTSDIIPMLDASDNYEIKYADSANVRELIGTTATAAELDYLDIATLGTGAASKAVVLDASGDYTYPATATIVYPSSATLTLQSGSTFNVAGTFQIGGTAVGSTAAEIDRVADVSARVVTLVASGAISLATHEGKTLLLGEVGGNALCAMTLPAATGSGAKYLFKVSVVNTSNYTITTNGAEVYNGTVLAHDRDITDGTLLHAFAATTQTIITLNGGTTGGQIGDWIELEDILTGVWAVRGVVAVPAGSNPATCFS